MVQPRRSPSPNISIPLIAPTAITWTERFWSATWANMITASRKALTRGLLPGAEEKSGASWALPEQRVQVTPSPLPHPGRLRPRADAPYEQVVSAPPYLHRNSIEGRYLRIHQFDRLDDYLAMGVANVWVIDPRLRRGYRYTAEGLLRPRTEIFEPRIPI